MLGFNILTVSWSAVGLGVLLAALVNNPRRLEATIPDSRVNLYQIAGVVLITLGWLGLFYYFLPLITYGLASFAAIVGLILILVGMLAVLVTNNVLRINYDIADLNVSFVQVPGLFLTVLGMFATIAYFYLR